MASSLCLCRRPRQQVADGPGERDDPPVQGALAVLAEHAGGGEDLGDGADVVEGQLGQRLNVGGRDGCAGGVLLSRGLMSNLSARRVLAMTSSVRLAAIALDSRGFPWPCHSFSAPACGKASGRWGVSDWGSRVG